MIIKYTQTSKSGIQTQGNTRHGIGYIVRGKKYIYYGDVRYEINRGDVFYLGIGNHYTEDVPEPGKNFEQIIFYYSPEQLSRTLNQLSIGYQMNITNHHSCPNCSGNNHLHVICPAWSALKSFFGSVNQYIKDDIFSGDDVAENIKITELAYLILSNEKCCIKNMILSDADLMKENFEQIIHNHIFSDISIDELARKSNRSLTSFKKEFKRHFYESPHKWFISQRLMHSRLLLISTNKSISEVGAECNFPNTSHFIKLFKKEYGMTCAAYRSKHRQEEVGNEKELLLNM